MTATFDPLATSELIIDGYRRYLRSLLPVRDARIAAALDQEISRSALTKGPLLESAPPYAHGATLADLVAAGVLHPAFQQLASDALPMDRPLYLHQEQAIRKVAAGRNVIVASGTGSGKTESFLVPILDALSAEQARGTLGPGVRALLLYPINALANDQIKRLRQLLARAPHITFGRYVGDTPYTARDAAEKFAVLNPGEPRLSNELLSRAEMREAPPQILLTNYAMLEYLLLRPADIDLFEGAHGGHWSFIAVDEAHVYDGAKAAELAMLLRRLRDRVAGGRPLRCIATSATVGDEPRSVTDFARALFDADFDWVPDDESRQDLIRATRRTMPEGPFWGPLDPSAYFSIARSDDPAAELMCLAEAHGVAGHGDAAVTFAHERRIADLRARLATRPRLFNELAAELFTADIDQGKALAALVTAGARLRDSTGSPVLSARYHLFARASEGAYTCLSKAGPHVSLARRETCGTCSAAMFEFAACKRCGALYLSGSVRHTPDGLIFGPRQRPTERRIWLLAGDTPVIVDEDDETLEEAGRSLDADIAVLCAVCGALHTAGTANCPGVACGGTLLWPVRRLSTARDTVSGCLACGARGAAMVRQFETGGDA
ncbi:MAG: DEAD/DEAH box helicase, partial [Streptosporangiaceae bacterium]